MFIIIGLIGLFAAWFLPTFLLTQGFLVLKPDIVQSDWLPYSKWIFFINLFIIAFSVGVFWFLRYKLYWSYKNSFILSLIIISLLLFLENFVFKFSYKSDYIESGEGLLSFLFTFLGILGYLAGILLVSVFKKDIGIYRYKIFEFLSWPF
ncbi:MAG: hypothetical protein ABIL76_01960 [candidate division WOR-3 bacterium]